MSDARYGGTGRWTRTALSAQVVLAVLLAAAVAVLLTWLAARPALRWRVDLTALNTNTLDPELTHLIRDLPERAVIEVFFRPLDPPLTRVGAEAQARMGELLVLARNQFPDKLRVILHDTTDVATAAQRMNALGLQNEDNVVVVQLGERKAVLRLLRDIARVDPGNPMQKRDPSLESFRGEEALGNALLRVEVDETPRVWFTSGHGERDLYELERGDGLGRLHSALVADGLRAELWDSARAPRIPDDVAVVAIVDARQPLPTAEFDALREFIDRGGRLFAASTTAAAAFGAPGGTEDLLQHYGIRTASGFIAQLVPDGFNGWRDGIEACATLVVAPARGHPVSDPLFQARKYVGLPGARAFERGTTPKNGVLSDLLLSPGNAWRDLPDARGVYDWRASEQEDAGQFTVAVALAFPPPALEGAPEPAAGAERPAARILALGSPDALCNASFVPNRDFALNAFNWLAARDRRLVVRPRAEDPRLLDLRNSRALSLLNLVALVVLPGACALLGFFLAWRRRR